MTSSNFRSIIKAVGFPAVEAEYKKSVNPPYLIILKDIDNSIYANGKKVIPIIGVNVELYTEKNDNASQAQLEDWFESNEVDYKMIERSWITEENFYVTVYKIELYGL